MNLTTTDRVEIYEVIALHGHLCDERAYDRFDEVFAPDLEVDATSIGLGPLQDEGPTRIRLEAYISAAHRHSGEGTLALHVTNTIVDEQEDGVVQAWSKGIALQLNGLPASFVYEDELVRTSLGWRIRRRRVSARPTPEGAA